MANEDATPVTGTSDVPETETIDATIDNKTEAIDNKTESVDNKGEAAVAPKDWATRRSEYAKGDEKLLKRLERYSSEESVIDALINAQAKIAEKGSKLPKDATPEQLSAWRADNGIPEKPEEYDMNLGDGRTIGEADKPFVDEFLKKAHEHNMTPDQAKSTVAWYMEEQERQIAERQQQDASFRAEAEEKLRSEWGSEYKLNTNLINGMLDSAPEGVKDQLLGARLADGTPLGNDPGTLRWLANLAREVNPTATVVPGAGGNASQAIESELANIVKLMGDRKSEYWKGPQALKMQERYRELITVQEKIR